MKYIALYVLVLTLAANAFAHKMPQKLSTGTYASAYTTADGKINVGSGADTVRLSVIDGVERLGPNPLVLINGVEHNKEILYTISDKNFRGSSITYPNNGNTKYGEKAKDGAVEIKTINEQIAYLTANEKRYLVKKQAVKGMFFSRFTYTKEDGTLVDEARIRRATGGGSAADLAPGGRIAFVINNKVYNEAEFKRLFPVDKAEYGKGLSVGGSVSGAKERGLNLEGYDLVFDFGVTAQF